MALRNDKKFLHDQCLRYADIKNLKKIEFDDVLTFIEEVTSLKNGTLEVKIKDGKAPHLPIGGADGIHMLAPLNRVSQY